jgi:hypothetical protein
MRSRMVLNEPQLAAEALRSGLAAFPDDRATQARLREAAQSLGVPGSYGQLTQSASTRRFCGLLRPVPGSGRSGP